VAIPAAYDPLSTHDAGVGSPAVGDAEPAAAPHDQRRFADSSQEDASCANS